MYFYVSSVQKRKNQGKNIPIQNYNCLRVASKSCFVTVSENEYGTYAILWSKSAIFRGAWQNVNMQERGTLLYVKGLKSYQQKCK